MSVWRRFDNHGFPSLITTNIHGRRPVLASPGVAKLLVRVMSEVRHQTRFQLLAFVLMPDHIHLVIAVPIQLKLGGWSD